MIPEAGGPGLITMDPLDSTERILCGLKSLAAGVLITLVLLFPLALFGAFFWNFWHQDGPPPPPPSWTRIAWDAVAGTVLLYWHWRVITLPVSLGLAYYRFRRKIGRSSTPV